VSRWLIRRAGEEPSGLVDGQARAAELPHLGALDPAAELEHHRLHAVADAEHGNAELEQLTAKLGRAVRVDGCGPSREDQPLRLPSRDLLERHVMRKQLGEHAAFPDPPRDQLRVLAPEVEHEDLVGRGPRDGG
jgi:hypothetical protein